MNVSIPGKKNYVFLGGAGSGKSELSINFALCLASEQEKPVHFFDLDMTKPLFRSRDQARVFEKSGVVCHFEEQFMDAPTQAGGVSPLLRDPNACTVLDVGGDYIGARAVGWYGPLLNRPDTAVLYVLNAYRPWMETRSTRLWGRSWGYPTSAWTSSTWSATPTPARAQRPRSSWRATGG